MRTRSISKRAIDGCNEEPPLFLATTGWVPVVHPNNSAVSGDSFIFLSAKYIIAISTQESGVVK
jgi:hypothetical protein